MKKFEYKTQVIDTKGFSGGKIDEEELDSILNAMGRQGWELVRTETTSLTQGATRCILFVFKREAEA